MGLAPVNYQVKANGQDITRILQTQLLMLRVTDAQGDTSDTVEIELDNRGQRFQFPETGASLDVSIGYGDDLIFKGTYEVDEIEEPLESDTLTIHGKAAKMKASFKAPRDASFDDITLGALVEQIAGAHQFEPVISDTLAAIHFEHIDQVGESDMNLLTRLARDHGAMAKPVANRLLVLTKDEAKTAKGNEIQPLVIDDPAPSRGRVTIAERSNYQQVKAYFFDEDIQERQEVTAGSGEPIYVIRTRYPTAERAQAKADAKLRALQRGKKSMALTRPLIPELIAETPITVKNHKDSANGDWIVEEVTHQIVNNQVGTSSMILHLPKK